MYPAWKEQTLSRPLVLLAYRALLSQVATGHILRGDNDRAFAQLLKCQPNTSHFEGVDGCRVDALCRCALQALQWHRSYKAIRFNSAPFDVPQYDRDLHLGLQHLHHLAIDRGRRNGNR